MLFVVSAEIFAFFLSCSSYFVPIFFLNLTLRGFYFVFVTHFVWPFFLPYPVIISDYISPWIQLNPKLNWKFCTWLTYFLFTNFSFHSLDLYKCVKWNNKNIKFLHKNHNKNKTEDQQLLQKRRKKKRRNWKKYTSNKII